MSKNLMRKSLVERKIGCKFVKSLRNLIYREGATLRRKTNVKKKIR